MIILFIILAVLLFLIILCIPFIFPHPRNKIHNNIKTRPTPSPNIIYETYPQYPFWNALRSTRNMSYDLRGEAGMPPLMWTPFNMSPHIPIINEPLYV